MSDGRLAAGYGDVWDGWEASEARSETKKLRKEITQLREELAEIKKKLKEYEDASRS